VIAARALARVTHRLAIALIAFTQRTAIESRRSGARRIAMRAGREPGLRDSLLPPVYSFRVHFRSISGRRIA
jgi:hypothetical protein